MLDDCLRRLTSELGSAVVLTGMDIPDRSGNDWGNAPYCLPSAFVRPANTEEMALAVSICTETRTPFVIQGGMTGMCGGGTPEPGWVAISTERLTGVEEIDAESATLTVKAGTPLEVVQKAADEAGFLFPLDLGARGSCTIGGIVSTNAGGVRVIKYGMARHLVLGLEAVLPDGTVLTAMNKFLKRNSGYDLKHIFIGSEGTLGVVTRVVLRLFPKPGATVVAFCTLETYDKVLALLSSARNSLGFGLSAFEVMWSDFWDVVMKRPNFRSPLAARGAFHVLIEAEISQLETDVSRIENWLLQMIEADVAADVSVAKSLAQAQALWDFRDSGAEFTSVVGAYVSYDLGLRTETMNDFAQRCRKTLAETISGCQSVYYGHIGDGNLHVDAWVPGLSMTEQPKKTIDEVVYGLVNDMGGIISAEHGIGKVKRDWLQRSASSAELEVMRLLKRSFDPYNLLNPGKVI